MRRFVLILPDLVAPDDDPSPLRQSLPALERMSEEGTVRKILPPPSVETPEAFWLGLGPNEGQMRQGPLTVSALGADPPERSLHFHLSLMSFEDGLAKLVEGRIPEGDVSQAMTLAKRLNTPKLTLVAGKQADHALVWEERGDLGTTHARGVNGNPLKGCLPEGDGEALLRRYIDDSINLLSEQEFNLRRLEAGLPVLNLLWPWGHGERRPVPNLILRRGERATVFSSSLRLEGLTRLTGYRNGEPLVGTALNAQLETLAQRILDAEGPTIAVFDPLSALRADAKQDEMHWLASEIDRRLLRPIVEASEGNPTRILVLAGALSLEWDSQYRESASIPFDERAFDERRLGHQQLWEAVQRGLSLA